MKHMLDIKLVPKVLGCSSLQYIHAFAHALNPTEQRVHPPLDCSWEHRPEEQLQHYNSFNDTSKVHGKFLWCLKVKVRSFFFTVSSPNSVHTLWSRTCGQLCKSHSFSGVGYFLLGKETNGGFHKCLVSQSSHEWIKQIAVTMNGIFIEHNSDIMRLSYICGSTTSTSFPSSRLALFRAGGMMLTCLGLEAVAPCMHTAMDEGRYEVLFWVW